MSEHPEIDSQGAASLRRSPLAPIPNPLPAPDYLARLRGTLGTTGAVVVVRYVPDKLVLRPEAFAQYLAEFAAGAPGAIETAAPVILGDLNNELVPRWVQVRIGTDDHAVLIEDRQPKWDNPPLLARLDGF